MNGGVVHIILVVWFVALCFFVALLFAFLKFSVHIYFYVSFFSLLVAFIFVCLNVSDCQTNFHNDTGY